MSWQRLGNGMHLQSGQFSTHRFESEFSTLKLLNHYPFSTNVPLLYTLKTSEKRRFSDVFRRYRSGALLENGLKL